MLFSSFKLIAVTTILAAMPQLPPYEQAPELKASEILPVELLQSEDHKIQETVTNDGFLNHYVIETPYGEFTAEGQRLLDMRLQEAHALAELYKVSNTDIYTDAAKNAVTAPIEAVGKFAKAPAETVKGIPGGFSRKLKSIGKSVQNVAKDVTEKDENEEGEDGEAEIESTTTKYAKQWFGVTGSQRKWAQKLKVDPYTSNVILKEKMASVAQVDAAANFGAQLAMPGLGAVSYVVQASNLVWSLDGVDLRAHNLEQLKAVGLSELTINEFLDNHQLSPTQQTIIVEAMLSIKQADQLELAISHLDWIETEVEAWAYTDSIFLMSRFHIEVEPIKGLSGKGPIPAVVTENDALVYVLPLDYLTWNESLANVMQGSMAAPDDMKANHKFWVTGNASESAISGLSTLGWAVETGKLEKVDENP